MGTVLLGAGSGGAAPSQTAMGRGAAITALAEPNRAGDIPDSQVFIPFVSRAGGYELQVPEGWARTVQGSNVRFTDKLDGVAVTMTRAASPVTAARNRSTIVADIKRSASGVRVTSLHDVRLPAGAAVLVTYTSDSAIDPVTGRRVRLEDHAYLFFRGGRQAVLTLWAPVGADNADQWTRIAQSFRWL
jgi:hypothetical protein